MILRGSLGSFESIYTFDFSILWQWWLLGERAEDVCYSLHYNLQTLLPELTKYYAFSFVSFPRDWFVIINKVGDFSTNSKLAILKWLFKQNFYFPFKNRLLINYITCEFKCMIS